MEESNGSKEAGYNKKHWWEGTPITYEALEEKAEHWTLGADAATATLLQQISSKMIARTHEVEAALKNVCEDVDDLHVSLSNVTTSLHLLSNMQFTENRTYQEDESSKSDSTNTNMKSEKSMVTTQEDLMSSCCQAIADGLELVKNSYMKMEISDSESEGGEEEQQKKGILTVYKRINPYENRKLPHLIGSSNFYTDDTLGLIDLEDDDEDRQINEEKWSTTSSVCSGDGRDLKEDDRFSRSLPIVANSSKMEEEDSDSDGSFMVPSMEVNKREVKNLVQHRNTNQVSPSSDFNNKKENSMSSTLLQPNSNGVLLDSEEEYGPIFEPPRDSYINRPSPRLPVDGEPLFRSVLKNPDLNHMNSEKERLFRGVQERPRERSKLFDLSDSDEEGLFSSKKERKLSGAGNENFVKNQNVQTLEDGMKDHAGEEAIEERKEHGFKDGDKTRQTSESNLPGRHKKPVGGINIFNAAVTKAIESQHLSGSNKEYSAQNNENENLSNGKFSRRESPSNEKDEGRGLFMPQSISNSHNINNPSSKATVSSNNSIKKASLFAEDDDDDDLFRPVSKSSQSTILRSPVLSKSKSLDSNTSVSVKSKIDQRATTLGSIFGDSDDDLFISAKGTQPNRNSSIVASSYQTEPPPLPQSSCSSLLPDKRDSKAKNVKSKVNIFSSSSSDDEIFTPRKSREKTLSIDRSGAESSANPPYQEPLNPPQTVDVKNSYIRSADFVTNTEHSNNPTLDKPSNTLDSSSELSIKEKKSIAKNHPSTVPKKSQIKSLFGSSDDDDDDIFTPKLKKISEKKVLASSSSDESSRNVLKPDDSKKKIENISNQKTVMDGNKELMFKNDLNPNTLSNNSNNESDSSEDDIFKSPSKENSKPKDTLSKFYKTAQLESSASQFGSTVSDSSLLPGHGTSSQSIILNTQSKKSASNANDIFKDSSDSDIFSGLKSKSFAVSNKTSDKLTNIDSSDDDLFSDKKPMVKAGVGISSVQNLSEKLGSDDLLSSNKVKDGENLPEKTSSEELTKTTDFDNSNIYGINNNNTKNIIQKKNKTGGSIFSSDSDEDIFSPLKKDLPTNGTKNIFFDSDDNDDIFSTNFKSKHKLDDNIDKNFGSQAPKLVKPEVPKLVEIKGEKRDSNKKPVKMPKPLAAEPIANEKENSSLVRENEMSKSHFMEKSKVNLPADNSAKTRRKSSLTKPIFDDGDDGDLFTSSKSNKSAVVTEDKALNSSIEKNRNVEKDSTDGISSSKPKHTLPKLGKGKDDKEVKTKHVNEKKPVGEKPLFQERIGAGGDSLLKEESLPQSTSPTKNTVGGLPFVKDCDEHSLSSPTKKPVGGVALFGGKELLSKLKSRRKSSSSESGKEEDTEGKLTNIKSSNFQSIDSSSMVNTSAEVKPNKISHNQIPSPTGMRVTQVLSSISDHTITPSISEEASVSFDSEERASDLLISVNKDRPKIQHQRKPPSRLRKTRKKTIEKSDSTDSDLSAREANINKGETVHEKVSYSSSCSENQTSVNSENEGKPSTMSYDKSPPHREKSVTLEKKNETICENNEILDSKAKTVLRQENSCHKSQNKENSCAVSENKKSFTKGEVFHSKVLSSSLNPPRKIDPSSLDLEADGTKVASSEIREESIRGKAILDNSKEQNSHEKNVTVSKDLPSQEKSSKKSFLKIFDDDNEGDGDIFSSAKPQSEILHKNVDTNLNRNKVSVVEKHLNVDDIFNDEKSEDEINVGKLSKPSTNIFGDDDEDIDSLFNASTKKKLSKTTELVKVEQNLTKKSAETLKTLKPSSSIFSDDDEDDDSLFSSTAPSSKKIFAPPKVKTGKSTAKQLSIFDNDDDDSESELFGGASSVSASKEPPPKTDWHHSKASGKETQKSLPSKSAMSKERTFVDPLMGNLS